MAPDCLFDTIFLPDAAHKLVVLSAGVDRLLKVRENENTNDIEILVAWQAFEEAEFSWEPAVNILEDVSKLFKALLRGLKKNRDDIHCVLDCFIDTRLWIGLISSQLDYTLFSTASWPQIITISTIVSFQP